ncbi:MAG: DUF1223 domain-containing protein [Pseudobdellovibrionaceae bacterium]|jgi:hypothetical protein|nr:DUF1223 domain-containing protein [Pseudobdellovibrionaceae bacterium]
MLNILSKTMFCPVRYFFSATIFLASLQPVPAKAADPAQDAGSIQASEADNQIDPSLLTPAEILKIPASGAASGTEIFGYRWPFEDRDLAAEIGDAPILVEFYSDWTCAYCAPVDQFFNDLVQKTPVIGIACHVDLMNVMPDDPLVSKDCIKRQGMYTARLWRRRTTPDIFINGKKFSLGFRFHTVVDTMLAESKAAPLMRLNIKPEGNATYAIDMPEIAFGPVTDFNDRAFVSLFEYKKPVSHKTTLGPNMGREGVYRHVVSHISPLPDWFGEKGAYTFDWTPSEDAAGAVIIMERKDSSVFAVGEIKLINK